MAFITADRVKDTSTTTGTGNITVSGSAPFGYRTFSTVLSVGDTFYYAIQGQSTAEWEVGLGTYASTNQFARTTVLASSASGSTVSFSSGTKNVFVTLPATKTFQLDPSQSLVPGAVLYGTGDSTVGYTAAGTGGQVLISNAAGAPTWQTVSGTGTVTSVAVSGGSTGFTTSGGPITGSGTITMAGTLAIANGGTGLTSTPANGALDIGNGTGFTRTTLTAGANITITNTAGGISIAASGAGTPNTIANGTSNVGIASSNGSIVAATNGTTAFTVDTSQNITAAGTVAMASSFKRNRIINGNMVINQRAATITSGGYCTDRWLVSNLTTGAWTCAQSSTAPTGFTNSLLFTKTTGGTPSSGDVNYIEQVIEGLNCYDLAWGTANAKTVTLSFWVYAGATGTFGGSLRNSGATRSYPFTYTISASNTWTNISVTIAGDTTGTWATDNTAGICVFFDIGSGTTYRATAGAWAAGNYVGATGATTYPTSTSGGTFYLTGVQLEVGTVATPYERQIYSDQLAQCQRYYFKKNNSGMRMFSSASNGYREAFICFPVTMRATPTVSNLSATGTGSGTIASFQTTSQVGGAEVNVGNTTDTLDWNTADFAAEL